MNILKFLLYAGAVTITLGIINEDEEIRDYFKDLLKEFEPEFSKIVHKIDNFLADESRMNLDKINLVAKEKLSDIENYFKTNSSLQKETITQEDIDKLKKKLVLLEKKVKQKKIKTKNKV